MGARTYEVSYYLRHPLSGRTGKHSRNHAVICPLPIFPSFPKVFFIVLKFYSSVTNQNISIFPIFPKAFAVRSPFAVRRSLSFFFIGFLERHQSVRLFVRCSLISNTAILQIIDFIAERNFAFCHKSSTHWLPQ